MPCAAVMKMAIMQIESFNLMCSVVFIWIRVWTILVLGHHGMKCVENANTKNVLWLKF